MTDLFDVFLSHSSADKPLVAGYAAGLRERGVKPWLDVEQIIAGTSFQGELGIGLQASRSFAVFVGAERVGAWVREELDAAIAKAASDSSFRVFLILLPSAPHLFDPTDLHPFLSQRSWVDLRGVDDPGEATELVARAAKGEPLSFIDRPVVIGEEVCPYVGLTPFREADATWFYGREGDTQRIAEKLRHVPFLAVLGRSGAGKSSAVRAGLLPAIRTGRLIDGSHRWDVQLLRPTTRPLEALAAQVSQLRPDVPVARILGDLQSSDVALRVLTVSEDSAPVLWIVDQAEELFTLSNDSGAREAFVGNLLHVSRSGDGARLVLTIRSDFYHRFASLSLLADRIASHQYVVTDLDEEALSEAIMRPAMHAGLTLEPGLVDRILADVRTEIAALPLLQHALRELWERRESTTLTHDAYTEIGGVGGALARHADDVLAKLSAAGNETTARHLLTELIRLGEGESDTKQPARLSELAGVAFPIEQLQRTATALADARLVTTDVDTQAAPANRDETWIELGHEALVRSWPALRNWIDESRDEMRFRRRVRDAARAWSAEDRPDDLLYRGTALAQAESQLGSGLEQLGGLEHDFLLASRDHARAQRSRRRRSFVAGGLTLLALTVLALAAAVVATIGFGRARDEAGRAERNSVLTQAQQAVVLSRINPPLALALSAEAAARVDDPAVMEAMHGSHLAYGRQRGHIRRTFTDHTADVMAVAFGPLGRTVATGSADGTVRLWDRLSGDAIATFSLGEDVFAVAFSPDGSKIAAAGNAAAVTIWDVESKEAISSLPGHGDAIWGVAFHPSQPWVATTSRDGTFMMSRLDGSEQYSRPVDDEGAWGVAFSPDGARLATTGNSGTVTVWDLETATVEVAMSGHADAVRGVTFSPDGLTLATASEDNSVRLWDTATGLEMTALNEHENWVWGVAFSSDGSRLASASLDGTSKIWDLDGDAPPITLSGHQDGLRAVAFDESFVLTASNDNTARLWNLDLGSEVVTLQGHSNWLRSVRFSPDGQTIATGSADRTARLWDAATGEELARLDEHSDEVWEVAFSPDGTTVASTGEDETVRLWDARTGASLDVLDGAHEGGVWGVAFSPSDPSMATAGEDGTARIWDLGTSTVVANLTGHEGSVRNVAFSPDGSVVATASDDGTVRLWDPISGEQLHHLDEHDGLVWGVAFSPDGTLATTGDDKTVRLWDASTGTLIATLVGHTGAVRGVAFSHDGSLLASTSNDRTTKIWDPANGSEITTLTGHTSLVRSVAFSPDDDFIATASTDGTAIVRRLRFDLSEVCALVIDEVARNDLVEAMNGAEPIVCTELE